MTPIHEHAPTKDRLHNGLDGAVPREGRWDDGVTGGPAAAAAAAAGGRGWLCVLVGQRLRASVGSYCHD